MPWFKVDDNLALHAKVSAAGNSAMGLWVRCGSWSAQQLTDGHIPHQIVLTFGTKQQAERLVAAGLWSREDGGYHFWQWEERQPTREAVEAERDAAKERMRSRRSRRSSGDVRANADRTSEGVRGPRPDPTRPDPTGVPSEHPGETGGISSPEVTRAREAPPTRCPLHTRTPSPGPCGSCGDARRDHDAWTQARVNAGLVVGGLECVQHPGEPAGRCGRCAAEAAPPPTDLRVGLRAARAARTSRAS